MTDKEELPAADKLVPYSVAMLADLEKRNAENPDFMKFKETAEKALKNAEKLEKAAEKMGVPADRSATVRGIVYSAIKSAHNYDNGIDKNAHRLYSLAESALSNTLDYTEALSHVNESFNHPVSPKSRH